MFKRAMSTSVNVIKNNAIDNIRNAQSIRFERLYAKYVEEKNEPALINIRINENASAINELTRDIHYIKCVLNCINQKLNIGMLLNDEPTSSKT